MLNSHAYHVERRANGAARIFAYGTDTTQYLSMDQIRSEIPSIFAADKHESRSQRYTFIPTSEVLDGLLREGFVPTEVRQGGSRIAGKADYTKHMIRLRHRDFAPNVVGVGDTLYPEIVLSNAHDGTGSYVMDHGAYRVLCRNAMVASKSYGQIKVAHKGDIIRDVIEGAFRVVETLPKIVEQANHWKGVTLTQGEQLAFANAARQLRWEPDDQGHNTAPIEPAQLNEARRVGDRGNDLWLTFNRNQEGLLAGGARYTQRDENGRRQARRTVRPVNAPDTNRQLNQALWVLAEEMERLKAA